MIEINRILCPVDFSEYSEHALRYAIKIAHWYDAKLYVLHVMPPAPPAAVSALGEAGRNLTIRNFTAMVDRWRRHDVSITSEVVESADATARIIERAEMLDVDLVVTGSHGRTGAKRMLFGSVVEPLLHRSLRPVMVVPAALNLKRLQGSPAFGRILCAVDFAAASLSALAYAFSLAEEADSKLTLLNVIDVPPELATPAAAEDFDLERVRAEAEADRLLRLRALVPEHAREYCTVETAVLEGGVSRQILRLADDHDEDLVVIGVHGRNALGLAVFGSNAKDVITRAHCPVLIVPATRRRGVKPAVAKAEMARMEEPVCAPRM